MKASVISKIYPKGESRNTITKTVVSQVNYIDAVFAIGAIVKTLYLTGWTLTNCQAETICLYYESGLILENYSNERMILKIKTYK